MKKSRNQKCGKLNEWLALGLMSASLSLIPGVALAQASGSQGGGEDGVFKGIRDEVGTWIQKNIAINQLETKLELKSISGVALQASFNRAVTDVGEKVVFTTQEIKIGDNSRICKNENKTITCNVDAWNNTRGDTRYMIVFHEYLGVAGIETNAEVDYSRYPISSKIRSYAYSKESFELGMEKNDNQKGIEGTVHRVYFFDRGIQRIGYELITKTGKYLLLEVGREILSNEFSQFLEKIVNRKMIVVGSPTKVRFARLGFINIFVIESYQLQPEKELTGILKNEWDLKMYHFLQLNDSRSVLLRKASPNISLKGLKNQKCSVKGYFKDHRSDLNTYFVEEIKCGNKN